MTRIQKYMGIKLNMKREYLHTNNEDNIIFVIQDTKHLCIPIFTTTITKFT